MASSDVIPVQFWARQLRWLDDRFSSAHALHRRLYLALADMATTVCGDDDPEYHAEILLTATDLDAIGDAVTRSAYSRLERQIATAVCAARLCLEREGAVRAVLGECGLALADPAQPIPRVERGAGPPASRPAPDAPPAAVPAPVARQREAEGV